MNRIVLAFVAVATGCTASATNSYAVSIFANAITDPNPSTANPFTAGQTFDPNITVTGIARGPGVTPNAGSNRYNAASWSFPNLDAGDYFTFTLTPAAGYEIDFNSVSGAWQRSGTGPNNYTLKTSLDNFVAPVASGNITGSGSPSNYNLDLSTLQNVTSPIEIRLYGYAGTGGTGTFSFNDFTFDGSVNQVTGPSAFAGDYNDDGVVDGADFAIWRKSSTDNTLLAANETVSPGVTDAADYDEWRANYGNTEIIGGGAGLSASATIVPEPSSIALLVIVVGVAGAGTRMRRESAPHLANCGVVAANRPVGADGR